MPVWSLYPLLIETFRHTEWCAACRVPAQYMHSLRARGGASIETLGGSVPRDAGRQCASRRWEAVCLELLGGSVPQDAGRQCASRHWKGITHLQPYHRRIVRP